MKSEICFRISFVSLNLLIGTAAAALIVLGGIFLSMSQAFLGTISTTSIETFVLAVIFNVSVLFIIAGSIILVIVVVGIIGSFKLRICGVLLIVYCCMIGFIVLLQLSLITVLAVRSTDATNFLQNNVTALLTPRLQNDTLLRNGLSQLERVFQCCGLSNGYLDYSQNSIPIPLSCSCPTSVTSNITCAQIDPTASFNTDNITRIYATGCVDAIVSQLDSNGLKYGLGGAAVAIIVVELLLILFATCMTCLDFKKEKE